jgi:hypothetical protein
MSRPTRCALILGLLVLAPSALWAQPLKPRGIYAVVNLEQNIAQEAMATPPITSPAGLEGYFDFLYQELLENPAISGLAIQIHWDTLAASPPTATGPDGWTYLNDAFAEAQVAGKTVQLIVTAGFQSPTSILFDPPTPSCDSLFEGKAPPSNCGTVNFQNFEEAADYPELPLPWYQPYQTAFMDFLMVLAGQYGTNPALVSIAVAGPTAASAEMITPTNGNTPKQTFGTVKIEPNTMWRKLLKFFFPAGPGKPKYQNSDLIFIDTWDQAIDFYGTNFSGLTLVATTGNGLPNLGSDYAIPKAFTLSCPDPDMDCGAETTILSYFVSSSVGGVNNAKATQTSGLEAARGDVVHNLGVAAVKQLSIATMKLTSPSTQILGGAQFNTSFANDPVAEGCLSPFPPPPDSSETPAACKPPKDTCAKEACQPIACIPADCLAPGVTQEEVKADHYVHFGDVPKQDKIAPEQAEYNVLNAYFEGTPVASFFGGTNGTAPLNYLQIYSEDILYANQQIVPVPVMEMGGSGTAMLTAQDLLNLASEKLLEIAEP